MSDETRAALIDAARACAGRFDIGPVGAEYSAASCAAALMSDSGRVYTGVCIDVACGVGFCAEHAAVAEMLKGREKRVIAVVAVAQKGTKGWCIVPPCGRCREMLMQVDPGNAATEVIVSPERSLPLGKLLPVHWNDAGTWHELG